MDTTIEKINIVEIGKRIQLIRKEVLKMTQGELADATDSDQALVSRLERGEGVGAKLLFSVLNYFHANSISPTVVFEDNFDINLVSKKNKSDQMQLLVTEIQRTMNTDLDRLKLLLAVPS